MKKIYALAAAVALCGLNLSAFNAQMAPERKIENHQIQQLNSLQWAPNDARLPKKLKKQSRASELDLSIFDQQIFLNFFLNSTSDNNGTSTLNPSEEWIWSSGHLGYEEVAEGYQVTNLFGEEPFTAVLTVDGDEVGFELGQIVYQADGYNYILKLASFDNEVGAITEGFLPLDVYRNGMEYSDGFFGVLAYHKATGQVAGWYVISVYNQFMVSNATVRYTLNNNNGVIEVENRVYAQYLAESYEVETADGSYKYDLLSISNLSQFECGFSVDFIPFPDGYCVTKDKIPYVLPSVPYSDTQDTGKFFMASIYDDEVIGEERSVYGTEGNINEEMTTLIFPYNNATNDITTYVGWCLIGEDIEVTYGDSTPAEITFDVPVYELEDYIPGSGIETAVVDNENAPVEIFNLQGMKVANPEAGKVYIVKQGSKVSKVIIR